MGTLSTTAWVLHELGLAAGFGGNLFGQIALSPAVAEIQSKRERGKVTHVAGNRYKVVSAASLALIAGTWFAGRTSPRRRALRKRARVLTTAKDVLVGAALAGGAVALVVGRMLDKETERENQPIEAGSPPIAETRRRVARLEKLSSGIGQLNVVMNAAVLAVSTMLLVESSASPTARFLPRRLR